MIPIFKPFIPEGIIDSVEENLYSGKLAFGKNGLEFERSVSEYIKNEFFLSISSFNSALLVLISALDLKPGDEIIASPISCLASNQPFVTKGLKIKWVDVDPDTGTICLDDLKRKLSNKTKAVFVNYFCGYLSNVESIYKIVKEFEIPLIDDSIEAFGAHYGESKVGNLLADATVFSFQTVRLPNTIDGGGISFKNEALYRKAKLVRDYGIDRSVFRDELNEISSECDITLEGYGALMPEINSIIGLQQIHLLDNLLSIQQQNAEVWKQIIKEIPFVKSMPPINKTSPNYWVFGILADKKTDAIKYFREKGFYASGVHINNNLYSVFKDKRELSGVSKFMESFVALPCGWWVKASDILDTKW